MPISGEAPRACWPRLLRPGREPGRQGRQANCRPSAVAPIAALVLILSGCWFPEGPRAPSVVGVVERVERPGDGVATFVLENGAQVTLDLDEAENLPGSSGGPGTLLLAGRQGGREWYMSLDHTELRRIGHLEPESCFFIGTFATEQGDALAFDNGLLLPKADDFDPGSVTDGRFASPGSGFCVNEVGEVVFYES